MAQYPTPVTQNKEREIQHEGDTTTPPITHFPSKAISEG